MTEHMLSVDGEEWKDELVGYGSDAVGFLARRMRDLNCRIITDGRAG